MVESIWLREVGEVEDEVRASSSICRQRRAEEDSLASLKSKIVTYNTEHNQGLLYK